MADPQQRAVTAAFAPPPPLWKHFTRENLDKLEQIKTEASKDKDDGRPHRDKQWSPVELRALDVPSELRFLVPPEIPTGEYSVFGELQTLSTSLPSLKEQGIDQLYPEPATDSTPDPAQPSQPLNHAYYLLKISKSLLLNFLEFCGILSVSPEQFESKVEDMRNLFINAHHLLNLYRPHQARESLIMMMEEQLERSRQEIKEMDRVKLEIEGMLHQLHAEGGRANAVAQSQNDLDQSRSTDAQRRKIVNTRQVWDLLDEEDRELS